MLQMPHNIREIEAPPRAQNGYFIRNQALATHTQYTIHLFTRASTILEVLLAPHKVEARLGVLVALDVELASERLRPAEEDTSLGGCVNLTDALENHVPVGSAKVGRRAKTSNGVLLGVGVIDHDVGRIVSLDLSGKILKGKSSVSKTILFFFLLFRKIEWGCGKQCGNTGGLLSTSPKKESKRVKAGAGRRL